MLISVDVSRGSDNDKANFVDDMQQMGFELTTTENMFEIDTYEFKASSYDAAELEHTIRIYFDHDDYKELD